jgi:hypothetical protein
MWATPSLSKTISVATGEQVAMSQTNILQLESPSSRPHVLTMVNRLFEAPPPPIGYWTSALPPRHVLADADALAVLRTAEHHKIGFDPLEWPHFAGTFTWYERIVRAAQAHLFAPAKDEFEPGRWRKLLVDDLVMSADTAPHDVAAALGWTVSWLGPSQALAPATGFTAPASGLTAWLTRVPLRPPNVSPQR